MIQKRLLKSLFLYLAKIFIYDMLLDFAIEKGLENGFFQGSSTSQKSFIPAFDFKGL